MNNITTDPKQRLFVIPAGHGVSCFGFDNCYQHAKQLAELLDRPDLAPREDEIGTLTQYEQYRTLVDEAGRRDLGTYFEPGTPDEVREILERYRLSGDRLRIFYGDSATGRDWLEEYDAIGRIGRSGGSLKVPLLLHNARSHGGPTILTSCIVRLMDVATRRELYRHPTYNRPELTIESITGSKCKAEVRADDQVYGRFATRERAERWVAFMRGDAMRK